MFGIIDDAVQNYIYWSTCEREFGFLHRHGEDGVKRTTELKDRINNIMDDLSQGGSRTEQICEQLRNFFNNKIIEDRIGQPISGLVRANPHSFISFLLNRMKNFPLILKSIINDDIASKVIKIDDFRRNKSEINRIRKDALIAFRSTNFRYE